MLAGLLSVAEWGSILMLPDSCQSDELIRLSFTLTGGGLLAPSCWCSQQHYVCDAGGRFWMAQGKMLMGI